MASYMIETYKWIFDDLADPRVHEWPLMKSPIPVAFILVVYLWTIKVWLPDFMRHRPPYDLKTIIKAYNAFQVIANAILFYGLLTSGWTTTYHFGCLATDYSYDPEPIRMATWYYYTVMLKLVELIETAFFVLRKKDGQASFLHIYHHVITVTIMWLSVKYTAGGMATLTPLINTFVHVIMYSYYLLTCMAGERLRKTLDKYKMWITIIQMIQFTVLLIHILQALRPSCAAPKIMLAIYLPNLIFVYYLFWSFFRDAYTRKRNVPNKRT